jgi:adenylate cyclase
VTAITATPEFAALRCKIDENGGMAWSWPRIDVGTRAYPEKVARRLRAVNITAWIGAAVAAAYAVAAAVQDASGLKLLIAVNAADALVWAAIPLLHRFGPAAAPVAFGLSVSASNLALASLLGTGSGILLYFMPASAFATLFLGLERRWLVALFASTAAGLHVAGHFLLPAAPTIPVDEAQLRTTFVGSIVISHALLCAIVVYAVRAMVRAEDQAEREFERSETLLANILPAPIAQRLKDGEQVIADNFPEASILFADMTGFTAHASRTRPGELVLFVNAVFSAFDGLLARHGLEKIKTIGDAYMAASGVPAPRDDHAAAMADFALDLLEAARRMKPAGMSIRLRIGIASGPVVAGVVGTRKFSYDVWGDTVNVAARMEALGETGRIQVSSGAYDRLKDRYDFEPRGEIEVPGKGRMRAWYLVGRRGASATDTGP